MAIEDSLHRVKYIRSMADLARSSPKPNMTLAFGNIANDLRCIEDDGIREEAQALLQRARGTIYYLERDPDFYPTALADTLDKLAAFLEANDANH